MPLKVTCPQGHVLTLPESKAGKLVRCPQCGEQTLVPGSEDEFKAKKPPPLPQPAPAEPRPEHEAEPQPKRRGMRHDPSQIATAYWLGAALVAAALIGTGPAIMEFADHFRHLETSSGIARWAYLLILLAAVQIAYAVYVMQLPDWGTAWVATLFSLLVAAGYATLLGFLLLSSEPGQTVGFLQLADGLRQKAVSWCFLMLSLSCLLTYLGGRTGAGWYRSHATVSAALRRNAD